MRSMANAWSVCILSLALKWDKCDLLAASQLRIPTRVLHICEMSKTTTVIRLCITRCFYLLWQLPRVRIQFKYNACNQLITNQQFDANQEKKWQIYRSCWIYFPGSRINIQPPKSTTDSAISADIRKTCLNCFEKTSCYVYTKYIILV